LRSSRWIEALSCFVLHTCISGAWWIRSTFGIFGLNVIVNYEDFYYIRDVALSPTFPILTETGEMAEASWIVPVVTEISETSHHSTGLAVIYV
jgi:hypothetical protein